MKNLPVLIIALLAAAAQASGISVVPMPNSVKEDGGHPRARAKVFYETDPSIPAEGYRLAIEKTRVVVASSDEAGRFYAERTLAQLKEDGPLPCLEIRDAPAYRWRGIHVDPCRHFFDKDTIKRILDTMAYFKMNRLHWHLTEDQGWRIEIPGYPELVKYGSVVEGRGPCYYSEADLKEIVQYASQRHVQIVPEIELPGHFQAAGAAYPEFVCFPERMKDRKPRQEWGISDNVMCVSNTNAVKFLEDVLDYVCRVFPGDVVHIGGDECPRTMWKECPRCQAFMRANGMKSEDELQAWATRHFVDFLAKRGKRAVGWDEYLMGDVPTSAIGMVWRVSAGEGAGNLDVLSPAEAVKKGHDLVMSPVSHCYLDYAQGIPGDDLTYIGGLITLEKSYDFDPARGIPKEYRSRILGGQGNNWAEFTENEEQLQWKMWPRGAAIAEALWCGEKKGEYADFRRRIEIRRGQLLKRGINCAPTTPATVYEVHVSPTAPDGGDGSKEKPFNAFWPAQAAARRLHELWPFRHVTIYLHAGEYAPTESIVFDEYDWNVTVKAFGDDRVVFTGAKRITGFTPCVDRPGVFVADIAKCGYRGFERPLPSGNYESGVRSRDIRRESCLFLDGERLPLARWPDEGNASIEAVDAADGHVIRTTFPTKLKLTRENSPDLFASGYFVYLWDHENVPADVREDGAIALDFAYPSKAVVGNPFYLRNSLELLDAPGEWYLDRRTAKLYVKPKKGVDPTKEEWLLADAAYPLVRIRNTHDVRFENVVFEYVRGDAIAISAADDCAVSGSVIRHVGGAGVTVKGGSRNSVEGCVIHDLGFCAVHVEGGDRATLTKCGNALRDSEIYGTGRTLSCYTPGLMAYGCGIEATGNHFHDIPSSAIRIDGNDHLVASNLFERVVTESDDQGATDTYGDPTYGGIVFRHNVFRDIGAGAEGGVAGGCGIRFDDAISCMRVEGNRFQNCSHGQFGSVQIHMGRFNLVTNNLMIGGRGGVSISDWDQGDPGRWRYFITGKCGDRGKLGRWGVGDNAVDAGYFRRVDVNSEIWRARFPWLQHAADTVCTNTIVCNVMVGTDEGIQIRNRTKNTADVANVSFRRMPTAAELAAVPGFTPPPTAAEVGPKSGAYRKARRLSNDDGFETDGNW